MILTGCTPNLTCTGNVTCTRVEKVVVLFDQSHDVSDRCPDKVVHANFFSKSRFSENSHQESIVSFKRPFLLFYSKQGMGTIIVNIHNLLLKRLCIIFDESI